MAVSFSEFRWNLCKLLAIPPTAHLVRGYCLRKVPGDVLRKAEKTIGDEGFVFLTKPQKEEEIYLGAEDDVLFFEVILRGKTILRSTPIT